jgi:hypothetical protein
VKLQPVRELKTLKGVGRVKIRENGIEVLGVGRNREQ